ncbi:DUF3991 and toprim domain-containing protein [Neoaquamicrobium sediminum]|uniref:DUF3991 and toprim domain-containing protein n=1 Tax=Neoaquamicrobium sediminum TaxID=1849104 RepID=UPI0015665EF6|nr:DUF3991 and toprim domain-containing protein [Mesorhizobium sediminum]NRC56535.1 DUF3991 domain-containing protein [Mesorhizobium sediminum]
MDRQEIEELRAKVSCGAVLEADGWKIDIKESTRRAVKYRRVDGEIIIVIHDGAGWFDPLSDAKGDVFGLAEHLGATGFVQALERIGEVVGLAPSAPTWERPARDRPPATLAGRWQARPVPRPGSPTWRYLDRTRGLPDTIIRAAIDQNVLREGPHGSMWAAHTDAAGRLIGWEERGPKWRGFSTGGGKELFRFGDLDPLRVCITEAAIDAMSLAAIAGPETRTLYVSTGGGWSPMTDAAIADLARRRDRMLVAATDANRQGDAYAERIRGHAADGGCRFSRLTPSSEDWNDQQRARRGEMTGK